MMFGEAFMRSVTWRLGKLVAVAAGVLLICAGAAPARAQTVTFPAWINDSFEQNNKYPDIWKYFRNNDTPRFQLWTELGDPFNSADDFFFVEQIAPNNGNIPIVWPGGSRLWSGQRPTP